MTKTHEALSASETRPSALVVLRNRAVLRFFLARTIALLGSSMAPVALAFAALTMPGGSATDLGVVLMARAFVQILFLLVGGVVADHWERRRVMVLSDVTAGCTQTAIAALVMAGSATTLSLALLSMVSGAAAAMFDPAARSLMPSLVGTDSLQTANALLRSSIRTATIAGTALAGVLVAGIGPGQTLAVNAATFLVSAFLVASIPLRGRSGYRPSAAGPSFLHLLRTGWREFISRRWVWPSVVQLGLVNVLLAGPFFVLGPVVAQREMGGASAWATVSTAQALGFVVGSVLAIRLRPRFPLRVTALLTMGFPLPLFLLGATRSLAAVAIASFLAGVCIDVYDVLLETTLQRHVPEEALARVMSYETLGSFAMVPVGLAVVGPVSALAGTGTTLLAAACVIVMTGPLLLLVPAVRRFRHEPTP
ncbi:MFS transporter [Streptomyces sp. NEAU-Y11]|uniref:MFS transporter n=1 Tax=Streptomyces cucumeris TaxID=2962890 RepID=UPI0020C8CA76|nr:MFS transporter [Streptomyces sp. NEAU-Y11]MCP9211182.1 MFS transporter [Streptomyces sp. NEAU-Y11]